MVCIKLSHYYYENITKALEREKAKQAEDAKTKERLAKESREASKSKIKMKGNEARDGKGGKWFRK